MGRPNDVTSGDPLVSSAKRARRWRSLQVSGWLLRAATVFTYLFLYAPIVVIVVMSFNPEPVLVFPMSGWSLRWYGEFLQDKLIIRALLNSFFLGGVTALLSALIGTPCALALVRFEFPGKRFLSSFVLAPMILPNVLTAIGLLILLNAVHFPRGYPYLIIGHVIFGLPYIVLTVSGQLYGFPRELEEAALGLGAKELATFFEVTLPLIAPSIIAGMLFAFTISFQEYVATQFWATPSTYTLPIRIYSRLRDAITPVLNVVGVTTVCLSFGTVLIVKIMSRRSEGGGFYGL